MENDVTVMAETTYEYTKTTAPDLSEIAPGVAASTMSQTGKDDYESSTWKKADDKLYCKFSDPLSGDDKTKFDAIIAALPDDTVKKMWDEIPIPITTWERIGANMPAVAQSGVMIAYRFDDATSEECWITIPRPDGWDGESDMKLVVWCCNDQAQTGTKAARLSLRYATQKVGDQYIQSSSPVTVRADNFDWDADAPQKKFRKCYLTLPYNNADNPLNKKQIMMKLMRIADHAGDTLVGDLVVTLVTLRFQRNALGDVD